MTPETIEKAEAAGRYMLLVIHALVVVFVLALIWRYKVPLIGVGLQLNVSKFHLLVGFSVGLFWIGYQRILLQVFPGAKWSLATHYVRKGHALFWVLVFAIGAFAEEFWLAFCLFSLTHMGHPVAFSVTLTAAAFALGHAKTGLGGALQHFVFGMSQALIFVRLGSLLTIYCVHLLTNFGGLYWIRRARWRLS